MTFNPREIKLFNKGGQTSSLVKFALTVFHAIVLPGIEAH